MQRRYNVRMETDENGWYIATVPSVKGVVDQGSNPEEAYRNVLVALRFTVESMVEGGEEIPPSAPDIADVRSARVSI